MSYSIFFPYLRVNLKIPCQTHVFKIKLEWILAWIVGSSFNSDRYLKNSNCLNLNLGEASSFTSSDSTASVLALHLIDFDIAFTSGYFAFTRDKWINGMAGQCIGFVGIDYLEGIVINYSCYIMEELFN